MLTSLKPINVQRGLPLALLLIAGLPATSVAQSLSGQPDRQVVDQPSRVVNITENRQKLENYKGKNGVISVKTVVMGGDFRVTTIIPFKGNIADYHRLEIARPISLVGGALTSQVSIQQLEKLKSQLEEKKIFESISVIDRYSAAAESPLPKQVQTASDNIRVEELDSLESPIGSFTDMEARDKQRLRNEQEAERPLDLTMVTVIEVIDYAKGNRIKQALPLDLGKSILTIRLRYYDKDSGKEIGRQIVSGKSGGSSLLGPLSPRDALSGVADGFVDQVTRRVAASVR